MNLKRKLLAVVASSALVCSSAFAEGFYAKVGAAGAMSMKPALGDIDSSTNKIVANAYLGAGMSIMENLRIGVEFVAWMPETDVAESKNGASKSQLKKAFTISPVVYYDFDVSDLMSLNLGAKVGYAQGTFGADKSNNKDEAKKKAALETTELSNLTAGGIVGVGFKLLDSISMDVAYNLDYYGIAPTKALQDSYPTIKLDKYLLTHKASVGITFKF